DEPFLHALVPTVVASMHGSYPLLAQQGDAVARAVRAEEEAFARTIEQGGQRLARAIEEELARRGVALSVQNAGAQSSSPDGGAATTLAGGLPDVYALIEASRGQAVQPLTGYLLLGETVFELHDTYGFPVDLTRELIESLGGTVDLEGFETAM